MNRAKQFLCAAVFLLFYLPTAAADRELKITALKENKRGKYDITLNNAVSVKNIALKNKNGAKTAEFPVYVSKGRVYRQFAVLKKEYGNYIANALSSKSAEQSENGVSFKINKFFLNGRKTSVKAFASVIFEELLEVECRVMEGKNGFWIAWPSNKAAEGWESEFAFEDKNLKKRVEESLLGKYKNFENERKQSR